MSPALLHFRNFNRQIRLLQLARPLCELVGTPAFLNLLITRGCLLGAMLLFVCFTLLSIFLSNGSLFFELALFTCVCLATLSTHLAVLLTGNNNFLVTQLNNNLTFFFALLTVFTGFSKEVVDGTRDTSKHLIGVHLYFRRHCFLVHFLVLLHDCFLSCLRNTTYNVCVSGVNILTYLLYCILHNLSTF